MIEHQMLGPVADPYREQAATMRGEAGRLLAAIDDLDAAARIDASALTLHPEPVSLHVAIERAAKNLSGLISDTGADLRIEAAGAIALADVRALDRLLGRLLGALIGAAARGETITAATFDSGASHVGLSITRPKALAAYPADAVLGLDDEDSPASLLGLGFALRLARNLARSQGGDMTMGDRQITVTLPSTSAATATEARSS